jgi:hypothetical protein
MYKQFLTDGGGARLAELPEETRQQFNNDVRQFFAQRPHLTAAWENRCR